MSETITTTIASPLQAQSSFGRNKKVFQRWIAHLVCLEDFSSTFVSYFFARLGFSLLFLCCVCSMTIITSWYSHNDVSRGIYFFVFIWDFFMTKPGDTMKDVWVSGDYDILQEEIDSKIETADALAVKLLQRFNYSVSAMRSTAHGLAEGYSPNLSDYLIQENLPDSMITDRSVTCMSLSGKEKYHV